jgi:hypothetical protein
MTWTPRDIPQAYYSWWRPNRRARWRVVAEGHTFGDSWARLLAVVSTCAKGSQRTVLPVGRQPGPDGRG